MKLSYTNLSIQVQFTRRCVLIQNQEPKNKMYIFIQFVGWVNKKTSTTFNSFTTLKLFIVFERTLISTKQNQGNYILKNGIYLFLWCYFLKRFTVVTPLWGKCEYETCTPKSGNLESSGIPTTLELNGRGQNTSPWGVLYTIGKALKFKCRKWPHMSHSDICSTSYGQKKGRESNWQFDSRPQKVGNRPNPSVCRWSARHHWKALEEGYKFASDLILIRGLSWELWAPKVPGVQTGIVSGLLFGSLRNKSHLDAGVAKQHREYYMGEGGGFPRVRVVVSQVSPCCPWLVPTPRVFSKVN
jgi:hypothetical protein